MSRVDTKNNTADLFTKHLDGLRTRAFAKKLGLRFLDMAGGTNVGAADGGTNEKDSLQLSRGVSSCGFNMWQIVHYTEIDISTLTHSLPCCFLLCCLFFFSSSAYPQTDTALLYKTHPDSCTHMDRTGFEFNLSFVSFAKQEQFTLSC